jgi:hypothetical protein
MIDRVIIIADGWQAPETKLDAARALGLVADDGTLTDEITRRLNWSMSRRASSTVTSATTLRPWNGRPPGVELALRAGDPEGALEQLCRLRAPCLAVLGRPTDEIQQRAAESGHT